MIHPTIADLAVPIDTLRPYARNPRNGDIDAIAASLQANGQYRPIVVRAGTGEILAGNHTYAAAMALGWTQIAATQIAVDDEQAARIVLADNRTSDLAVYDNGLLAELLDELGPLDGTGYDSGDLQRLRLELDDDWAAGLTDVRFTLGRIQITMPANTYRAWAAEIATHHDPEAEIRKRLGL